MPRILHVSDLHFGRHAVPTQIESLERIVAREPWDAIVVSGDVSQRSRTREFARAAEFIALAEAHAPALVVPGNHDVAWWAAPFGIGSRRAMYARYRRHVRKELEPVLHLAGLTIVGLNSAQGVRTFTQTLRPRDLGVVGAVRPQQWSKARNTFSSAPAADLRVLVLHHNLLRGRLSKRWGLASRALGVEQAARTGAELVLCGHDHEDRIEQVQAAGRRFVVSTANTLSTRVRGGRPSSLNVIETTASLIAVAAWDWNASEQTFLPGRSECFER